MRPKLSFIIVLIALYLLASFAEGKADRRHALGIVGGGLIGGSASHSFNRTRYHELYPTSPANHTVVPHGSYKEITKERDPHNPHKYRKIVRMLYPTSPAKARIVPAQPYNATNITSHMHNSSRVVPGPPSTVVIVSKTKYKHTKSMAYRFVESLMALVVCAFISFLLR